MTDIIIAVISGVCVAIPSIIATISSNRRSNNLVIYRIDELDKKVHEHNNLIDRMYEAEKRIALLEDDVKKNWFKFFFYLFFYSKLLNFTDYFINW